jgi:serine acetyltransferase
MAHANPVTIYRASAYLHRHGFKRSARLLKMLNFVLFHAIIPPELVAGANFEIGHLGLGVVIHPRTILGDDVHLYHGVTLATDIAIDDARCMRIGNRVRVGAGAILVGPIEIGDGAIIGAGSVVTSDVEPGAVVIGVPARPLDKPTVGSSSESPRRKQ